jgi:hypothetical protein
MSFACEERRNYKQKSLQHSHYLRSSKRKNTNKRHKSTCTVYSLNENVKTTFSHPRICALNAKKSHERHMSTSTTYPLRGSE